MEDYCACCYKFLLNKNIRVQKVWIEACIEWIQEEHKKLPPKLELYDIVYEQWLMADLREVAESVLPSSLNEGVYTLNGFFALQVNFVMDVGHSAYSQLQKLKGEEIVDTGDDDIKEFFSRGINEKTSVHDSKWKEVSSRMLLLDITDGLKHIEAIEYQPFKEISLESLQPGCKVLIKGPVKCRNKLLLLKQENIQILGGNVESLLENNTLEKLLNKVLETYHDNKPNIRGLQNDYIKKETNKKKILTKNNNLTDEIFSGNNKNNLSYQKSKVICSVDESAIISNNSISSSRQNTSKKNKKDSSKQLIKTEIADDLFANDVLDDFPIDDIGLLDFSELKQKDLSKSTEVNFIKKTPGSKSSCKSSSVMNQDSTSTMVLNSSLLRKKHSGFNIDCELDVDADLFLDEVDIIPDLKLSKANEKPFLKMERKPRTELSEIIEDGSYSKELQANKEYGSLSDLVQNHKLNSPVNIKCWFQTLTSKLEFQESYRISGIITDGVNYMEVVLGDEVLFPLIGFSSKDVLAAVNGNLSSTDKSKVKQALQKAEQCLEKGCWVAQIFYDKNIYKVLEMKQTLF